MHASSVARSAPVTAGRRPPPPAVRRSVRWLPALLAGALLLQPPAGVSWATAQSGDDPVPAADATETADAAETASRPTGPGMAGAADARSPRQVIEGLQAELLAYMASAATGGDPPDEAVASLREEIRRTHDFPYIARVVLGRHWRPLGPVQQETFVDRFTELSLATYAERFAEFSGESFEILGESESAFGQRSVRAVLRTADGERSFEYLLRESEGNGWQIVNIIVDGVSDLALKRAEYATLVEDGGFDALMAELERQLRELDRES